MAPSDIDNKQPLIVIVGPTASGKTALAVRLAHRFNGEIICADSRTVYKEMDIGTAKPTASERALVPHWGLDLVNPGDYFSVADFKLYAQQKIAEIRGRNHIPFLVGGTGLYVDGIIFDFNFAVQANSERRAKLDMMTIDQLHKYCSDNNITMPENRLNRRYVIRAIERKDDVLIKKQRVAKGVVIVGISTTKQILQQRITERTEQLLTDNVVDEAIKLGKKYGWRSEAMTGNVYPLVEEYIHGKINNDELRQRIISSDRRLAKRQMTWFRRNPYIEWCNLSSAEHYLSQILASYADL